GKGGPRSRAGEPGGRRAGRLEPPGPAGSLLVVPGVLDHVAARLRAVTARPGAALHVVVVLELLTRLGAVVAELGARLAGGHRAWPLAGGELGRHGAEVAAVGAQRQRAGVLLLALAHQVGTVPGARLALQQARRALLGALVEVVVLLVVADGTARHLAARLGL